ncbi:hypothetical protein CVT25_012930 [Psilocybe cyanescens]|uniref:Glutathione S-transferase UstS-like C-terminal domain-containing protein n=1 Tax=Psilocybe cyanescens TaxID=93625 RepID=A0A409W6N7_PSICY|nr:hypothetical protein CVT25_012930 [Psilocybe cyanescens]
MALHLSVLPDMRKLMNLVNITPRVEMAKSKDRTQDWIKLQEAMDQFDAWFARNGGRVWGEGSEGWKKIMSWNGGRWKNLSDYFKRYETAA